MHYTIISILSASLVAGGSVGYGELRWNGMESITLSSTSIPATTISCGKAIISSLKMFQISVIYRMSKFQEKRSIFEGVAILPA